MFSDSFIRNVVSPTLAILSSNLTDKCPVFAEIESHSMQPGRRRRPLNSLE